MAALRAVGSLGIRERSAIRGWHEEFTGESGAAVEQVLLLAQPFCLRLLRCSAAASQRWRQSVPSHDEDRKLQSCD